MSFLATHLCGFGVDVASRGNDSFTKILLHMNGADAATTFVDSSIGGSAHTWTANGDAQVDAPPSVGGKFDGALLCDGTGDYLSTPDHADYTIGSNDFVCDCWFNFNGSSGTRYLLGGQADSGGTSAGSSIWIEHRTTNAMRGVANIGGAAFTVDSTTTITGNGWHHLAFVRDGTNVYMFINGTKEATTGSVSGSINDSSATWRVGATEFGNPWIGWIDEFRLSVGTNRGWTGATIPVPTQPYY